MLGKLGEEIRSMVNVNTIVAYIDKKLWLEVTDDGAINPQFRRISYDLQREFKQAQAMDMPFAENYRHNFYI